MKTFQRFSRVFRSFFSKPASPADIQSLFSSSRHEYRFFTINPFHFLDDSLHRSSKKSFSIEVSEVFFSKQGVDVPETEVGCELPFSQSIKVQQSFIRDTSPLSSPSTSPSTSPDNSPSSSPQSRPFGSGSRVVGLVALGFFRYASKYHSSPQTRLFQNLSDIYHLSPEWKGDQSKCLEASKLMEPIADRMPPLDLAKDSVPPATADVFEQENQAPVPQAEDNNDHVLAIIASFQDKVSNGRLVLCREDLRDRLHWKALGLFLDAKGPEIHSLRFQGVDITTNEARELGSNCLRCIRHVTFCENNLGVNDGSLGMLVGLLCAAEVLESAVIVRNNIKDYHVPNILQLIKQHSSTLANLSLCWNGLRDAGACKLTQTLRFLFSNRTFLEKPPRVLLNNLDLSYNHIGTRGQTSLTKMQLELQRRGRHISINTKHNCQVKSYLSPESNGWGFNFGKLPFAFATAV